MDEIFWNFSDDGNCDKRDDLTLSARRIEFILGGERADLRFKTLA